MRISTSMMMNNFAKTLEDKMGDLQKYSNEVSSTRSFMRASDNPIAAMQTIEASHEYMENKQYQTSNGNASSWMQATETTVNQVNDILKSTQEKATQVINGTNNPSDDGNIATSLQSYRDELVTTLNSSFNGRYIFGQGSGGQPPFKIGTTADDGASNDGKLMYCNYNATDANGNSSPTYVAVGSLTQSEVNGMKLSMPVDMNLGVKVQNGSVQQGTVFDAATSGLDMVISGFSGTGGTATNIIDQLTSAVSDLNSGNTSNLKNLIGNVQDAQSSVLKVDVGIGEKTNMLSFISGGLTDNATNISTQMSNSMEADPTQAIMQYNMSQTVYKESLSVSSTTLQESLIDFLK